LAEFLAQAGVGRSGYQPLAKEIEYQFLGFSKQVTKGKQRFGVRTDNGFAERIAVKRGGGGIQIIASPSKLRRISGSRRHKPMVRRGHD
jgi:hypothetical protein